MLVNCDVVGLEWVVGTFLSQDKVAIKEILEKVDQHTDNQVRFNLPSRLIAKKFVFRLMYGGSAYAYSVDPDFFEVGYTEKQWQGVIDEFYRKYQGLHKWHTSIVQEATTTGRVVMPTGRIFEFSPTEWRGNLEWPRTQILNYPVQGTGADLLSFARAYCRQQFRFHKLKSLLIQTVHDSIVADCPREEVQLVAGILQRAVSETPIMFEKLFKIPFNLPLRSEIEVGMNLADMEAYIA